MYGEENYSCDKLSSGYFPGVWVLKTDVSEHCIGSIFNRWLKLQHLLKMELIQCSETSVFNTQTPGNYPEDNLSLLLQGESLNLEEL